MAVSKLAAFSSETHSAQQPKRHVPSVDASSIQVSTAAERFKTRPFLVELSANPSVNGTDLVCDFPNDPELEDEYQESSVFRKDILGSCKSWLASMIVHLVVILCLALLTMTSSTNRTIYLEVAQDDFASLTELDDLNFDSAEFEGFDDADLTPETQVPQELMAYESDLDLIDASDPTELDFSNPLDSSSDQFKRLAREALSDEIVAGDSGSTFFGIDATSESIVYIVDRSGSMEGKRWTDATRELMKSINSLKADQKFFVFLFSTGCHPMPMMAGTNELVSATAANKERFRKWLARQGPDDSTMPLSSVRRALRMEPDTIFLLTDGQFYDRTGDYLMTRAEAQQYRSDQEELVINTIAFHCQFEFEAMLEEIARVYSGTFRSVQ